MEATWCVESIKAEIQENEYEEKLIELIRRLLLNLEKIETKEDNKSEGIKG
jgi:hypothetical protein